LPGVDEVVVKKVSAIVLEKNKKAIHLEAKKTFVDEMGKERRAGEQWMLTYDDCETFIPGVSVDVKFLPQAIVLRNNQYCSVEDYVDSDGKQQLGSKKIVKGPGCFFLKPGEKLSDSQLQSSIILKPEEALVVRAKETYNEVGGTQRNAGDRWFIYGPKEYFVPIEVSVLERRRAFIRIDSLRLYLFYSKFSFILFSFLILLICLYLPRLR